MKAKKKEKQAIKRHFKAKSDKAKEGKRTRANNDSCTSCGEMFIGGEQEPRWIACDECDRWFHVKCTDDLKSTVGREEIEELKWICRNCLSRINQ